ncbi:MAG: hypothetical protein ACI82G_002723, partial [Bradymonadia bacterium]
MFVEPILTVANLIWMALVFLHVVRKYPPTDPGVAARATVWTAAWVSFWFMTLSGLHEFLWFLPFLKPLVWLAFPISYVLIFSEYYGLGYKRLPTVFGYHLVGALVWWAGLSKV